MKIKKQKVTHLVIDTTAEEIVANYLSASAEVLKKAVGEAGILITITENLEALLDAINTCDEYQLRQFFKGNIMSLMGDTMEEINAAEMFTINVRVAGTHRHEEAVLVISQLINIFNKRVA